MSVYDDVKKFLQDIIAPQMEALKNSVDRLEGDMRDMMLDIKQLCEKNEKLNERLSKLEGKIENFEESIFTKIENTILKGKIKKLEDKTDK
jgi:predicted nuclease with TOPRIM domain